MKRWRQALELTVAIAALLLGLFTTFESVRWIGRPFPGFLWAERLTINQLAMRPGWEGAKRGLRFNERLLTVDDQPVRTSPDLRAQLDRFQPGEVHRFGFEGRAPVRLRIQRFGRDDFLAIALMPILSGLGYLFLGAGVRWARRKHPDAERLFWFCMPAALFNLTIFDNATDHTVRLIWIMALALIPAGMLPMAAAFREGPLPRFHRRLLGLFGLACGLVGALYASVAGWPQVLEAVWVLLQLLTLTGFCGGLLGLVRTRMVAKDEIAKRQVELVLLGWILSTGPSMVWLIGNMAGHEPFPFQVSSACFILFPAYLAFAVLRHRLFDLSLAIRRSATYTLVAVLLGGGYLALDPVVERASGHWPMAWHLLLTTAIAVAFAPLRDAVRRRLNRYLFRPSYDFQAIVSRFGKLTRQSLDPEAIKQAFRSELSEALKPATLLIEENGRPSATAQLPRGEFVVPLAVGGDPLGRVVLGPRASGLPYGPPDQALVQALCQQLSFTLRTVQLVAELQQQLEQHERYLRRLMESEDVIARLQQLDQLRRDAFSQASHDLRAPLASISLTCQSLLKGHLGPMSVDSAQEIKVILGNTQALGALIDGILDQAKHEAHKLVLDLQSVALDPVLREIAALVEPLAVAADTRLILDDLSALPPLMADARRLRQVLLNLLSNAVKFTPDGEVQVSAEDLGSEVRLRVRDTGIGMSEAQLRQLGEAFAPSQASFQGIAGSGLGLSLVKAIAELHGAALAVESQPGSGTTVSLRWPVSREQALDDREQLVEIDRLGQEGAGLK